MRFRPTARSSFAVTISAAFIATSVATAVPASANAAGECVANSARSLEVAPEFHSSIDVPSAGHRLWDMKVAWRDVNPDPGVFDWSVLDKRIAETKASAGGPGVLYVMGLTPQWAAADPGAGDPRWGAGTASPPASIATWTTYVQAVVNRYGNQIDAYEIWNEANLKTFWTGNAVQLADLTKAAYEIIKAGDPSATVLTPSVTTRLQGSAYRFNSAFIPAMLEAGGGTIPADAFAIHTYPRGDLTNVADAINQRAKDVRAYQANVRDLLANYPQEATKPLWDTEVNYGLAGPGIIPGYDWPEDQAAQLITQTYISSAMLGIDNTFWYQYTVAPQSLLGVQFTPGTPLVRQAWDAVPGAVSAARPCPAYDYERSALPNMQPWMLDINNTITAKAQRPTPKSRLITIVGDVTGFPENYPIRLQILRPGYTTWQQVSGRPTVDNGTVKRVIRTPKAFKARWVTESGNVVSNVVRVPAMQR